MKNFLEYLKEDGAAAPAGGGESSSGLDNPPGVKTSDIADFTPPLDIKKRKNPTTEEEQENG